MEFRNVRYELLRPSEVKQIREDVPIAYIPLGSLEWHSFQNPLGTDSLKAHRICCIAADKYGGVVLPPFYHGLFGEGDKGWGPTGWKNYTLGYNEEETFKKVMQSIVKGLLRSEWKVLVGVTGHDVPPQRDALGDAIKEAVDNITTSGFSVMEGEGTILEYDNNISLEMDHAGAWETSCMMSIDEDLVDLHELTKRFSELPNEMKMHEPQGIGGFDPIKYASPELGLRIMTACSDLIGNRAKKSLKLLNDK